MSFDPEDYSAALDRAAEHVRRWLASVPERPVPPRATTDAMATALGGPLPEGPTDPAEVVDLVGEVGEAGLMAMGSGRFFGWVIGGTLPAALASDWLVSAWDQNTGLRAATPTTTAVEEVAAGWLLDLLGLPPTSDVGFVTGGTMANFVGLAAGRQALLDEVGWDVTTRGLAGGPRIAVLVGAERHETVDLTLRYLGLGAPTKVAVDDQGRISPAALRDVLARQDGPVLLVLQAGNLHSGAFDPFAECLALAKTYSGPIWVHVDGAFGLFAAASPALRHLVEGYEGADSWATDAHKTLNVPYDCGIAVVSRTSAVRAALGMHAEYLIEAGDDEPADPYEKVPELSRRARGVPVWAALRSLGRTGVAGLVEGFVARAQQIAEGIAAIESAEVLNEVPFTQVCVAFGSDESTEAVTAALIADGECWMSGSRWRDRAVLRVSVCNWSTDADDVRRSVDAVRRAVAATA
jgi:glutamate/tyrosine decarboxylase-like PLP-dependent enzyme